MLKFLIVVLVIALAVYGCVMLLERQRRGPRKPPQRGPQRPLGPDDDPDFLRDLNRRRKPPRRDPD
ncbi:hypothetical protein [Nocardioides cavernaquae]|uniref:hypothetical protein n=1 Tax=Nocardioides cavernaquae TaxID=2321396 RepID=UPI0015FFD5F5|nr:hypothetical protein [Nocardioides cavernaquae]